MKIWVSSLADVHHVASRAQPKRVVSLLAPGDEFPEIDGHGEASHHKVAIDDIREEREGLVAPGAAHVENLVAFLGGWRPDDTLLVHCWAGISRSSATALIAACLHNPDADEALIGEALHRASPTAFPNTRLVALADDILGRGGRMTRAAQAICADEARLARLMRTGVAEPFHIPSKFDVAG